MLLKHDDCYTGVAQLSRTGPDGLAPVDALVHGRCYVVPPSPMLE